MKKILKWAPVITDRPIGPRIPHYTPIPEDCAYWNYVVQFPFGYTTDYWQLRTGSKVSVNGYTYVELILRKLISFNDSVTTDATIGYFRNDTVNQKVYFKNDFLSSPDVLQYDFTLRTSDSVLGNNFLYLDTITIGGTLRSIWEDSAYNPPGGHGNSTGQMDYIEGIGDISGFVNLGFEVAQYVDPIAQEETIFTASPILQSFCVCGQLLYKNTNLYSPYMDDTLAGQCTLLTGINNLPSPSNIKVYPNPSTDQIHLSYTDAGATNAQFIITDILGQRVYTSTVSQSETTHDISGLSASIYTWRLVSDGATITTGKVVKQ